LFKFISTRYVSTTNENRYLYKNDEENRQTHTHFDTVIVRFPDDYWLQRTNLGGKCIVLVALGNADYLWPKVMHVSKSDA
jgi:hypothetical protein